MIYICDNLITRKNHELREAVLNLGKSAQKEGLEINDKRPSYIKDLVKPYLERNKFVMKRTNL